MSTFDESVVKYIDDARLIDIYKGYYFALPPSDGDITNASGKNLTDDKKCLVIKASRAPTHDEREMIKKTPTPENLIVLFRDNCTFDMVMIDEAEQRSDCLYDFLKKEKLLDKCLKHGFTETIIQNSVIVPCLYIVTHQELTEKEQAIIEGFKKEPSMIIKVRKLEEPQ